MRVGEGVGDAGDGDAKAKRFEEGAPVLVVAVGKGGVEADHQAIEGLGEEEARVGIGRDVLDEQQAAGNQEASQAAQERFLCLPRKVMEHVEHVGRLERAGDGGLPGVAHDEARGQIEPLGHPPGHRHPPRRQVDAGDAPRGLGLREIRGKKAKTAANIQDGPAGRQEAIHHREEAGPQDEEAGRRIETLQRRERGGRAADRPGRIGIIFLPRAGIHASPARVAARCWRSSTRQRRGSLGRWSTVTRSPGDRPRRARAQPRTLASISLPPASKRTWTR